jgi:hypothetical protein
MMGWFFVFLGLVTTAIGGFLVYYGQDLVRRPPPSPVPSSTGPSLTLDPVQEKLLGLLAEYQRRFALTKLIVSRTTGQLVFVNDEGRVVPSASDVNVIRDLYGSDALKGGTKRREFERLMESMPTEYVRFFQETRLDSPFVVSVTDRGLRYLRREPAG